MLDVKEAAKIAIDYFNKLYIGSDYESIALEELERKGGFWHITLGYSESGASRIIGGTRSRSYKIFVINAETREVVSMKIRKV